jgi:hypothetical protein
MQASSASDTHSPTPTPQVLRGRGPDQSKCAEHQPRSAAAGAMQRRGAGGEGLGGSPTPATFLEISRGARR